MTSFLRHLTFWGCCALGLANASAQSSYPTPYAITTYAGTAGTAGSVNANGAADQFGEPESVAVDGSGNLYIADTENDLIRVITSTGTAATFAGNATTQGSTNGAPSSALFYYPGGVAVDSTGTIVYVADTGNDTIRKITNNVVTTFAGVPTVTGHADGTGSGATFANPIGIAVDAQGNVYVADEGNATIRKITAAGVVTTLAGTARVTGHADGTGASAQFLQPEGVAVDSAGNVFVADTGNNTIRMITPAGVVTTLAGSATNPYGSADGTGSAARFYTPIGIAVDSGDNLYVADTLNSTIRKITSAGVVTTLAGTPPNPNVAASNTGSNDGSGGNAQFYWPYGLTVDASGDLFIADTQNDTIRKGVSAAAVITNQPQNRTVATGGTATFTVTVTSPTATSYQWSFNHAAITGATSPSYTITSAQASNVGSYTVTITNASGSVTSNPATLTIADVTPPVVTTPANQTINAGATTILSVTATGGSIAYQWYFNGSSIVGAVYSSLILPSVTSSQGGYYSVSASNAAGSAISNSALLTVVSSGAPAVTPSDRLINLSSRSPVGTGSNILIAGFGISGAGTKQMLLRGVGPGLAATFSLTGTLGPTQLALYDGSPPPGPLVIATDIDWGNSPTPGTSAVSVSPQAASASFMNSVGAFSLATGSTDSAMEVSPPAGSYSSQVSGVGGATGIALAEIYDADTGTPTARLVNLSARADVGAGGGILIGGFGITGSSPETLLIRGVGPGLTATFGLTGTLVTPQLTLFDSAVPSLPIVTNTGWNNATVLGTSAVPAEVQPATASLMNALGAFSLATGSADCAFVVTLPPGNYTAQVSGVGNTGGVALIEVYEVP